MSPAEARSIVEALANGIDPHSGQPLPPHAALSRPEVIQALFLASRALEGAERCLPSDKIGRGWSAPEEARLLQAFDAGVALKQIAIAHGRSRGAIAARLSRLGRLAEAA
ncbi:hypothetical protein ACPRNU_08045 [Chromobacterium vaccinii]|uniref:hypothetical protein n=1 Tax=Chromobacterium TaxID=535 RepID=UPI0013053374|nr:hypothetical protein [Chromobacterium sp. ATCC 53434]